MCHSYWAARQHFSNDANLIWKHPPGLQEEEGRVVGKDVASGPSRGRPQLRAQRPRHPVFPAVKRERSRLPQWPRFLWGAARVSTAVRTLPAAEQKLNTSSLLSLQLLLSICKPRFGSCLPELWELDKRLLLLGLSFLSVRRKWEDIHCLRMSMKFLSNGQRHFYYMGIFLKWPS